MINVIGEVAKEAPLVTIEATNQDIDTLFTENPRSQGIVVLENEKPIALITRSQFYQQIGTLFGYSLYMGRSISLLMNKSILKVDYSLTIIEVSKVAMERNTDELYDYIIITKDSLYYGVVTIRDLLMKFAEIQIQLASYQNPLTGLPGNNTIDEQLKKLLFCEKFSVLYIDLDHFKSYNDTYGFLKGDRVIQATAALLQSSIEEESGFLGHIGGDDFIIILPNYNYTPICNHIIDNFNKIVTNAYSLQHLQDNYITARDRNGRKVTTPLLSISIAVATNKERTYTSTDDIVEYATKIKKICKNYHYSCYHADLGSCL
ncbi:GGDEF domain-containing protein [Evansella sp. AB-rgal1]|uniref:GGDEF domain-containing protein n=1 Tax=Evansella sp. AB-rgal1 TaxID=3242696 RepID=UPI00359DEA18